VIRHAVFWLGLLLAMSVRAAPVHLVDDAGQTLVFERSPQRIISLTPHLTELLFAVGAGAQVVGVDSASDFPQAARRCRVWVTGPIKSILALKPDLVIVWMGGNRAADIHALKQMRLPVLHTQATRLDDVARLLRLIGQASGHAGEGAAAAQDFSVRLAALQVPAGHVPPLAVFYQVWDRPLMTVGGTHWISDALRYAVRAHICRPAHCLAAVSREAVLGGRRTDRGGSDAPGCTVSSVLEPAGGENQAFVRVTRPPARPRRVWSRVWPAVRGLAPTGDASRPVCGWGSSLMQSA
jgi:iron complex transport system substrate-binding protein